MRNFVVPLGEATNQVARRRRVHGWLLSVGCWMLVLTVLVGCSRPESSTGDKSAPANVVESAPADSGELIAKLHWLGKRQLSRESNATNLMSIWKKPESEKLENQTLDKLATAPWRLLAGTPPLSNAPVSLLRPLLDDLVQAESYLEVRGATNQPGDLVLAIRLDAARASLWQNSLAKVLESLFSPQTKGPKSGNRDTGFSIHTSTFNLQLTRSGDWTLLGFSDSKSKAPASNLMADFKARIQRGGNPFPVRSTNWWVECELNALRLSDAMKLGWKLPSTFPQVSVAITGDGQNVRTRGQLDFDQPLPLLSEPWRVPLDLTTEPLIGLTVVRSIPPLFERLGILHSEQAKHFPDQFLVWLRSGPPLQIYFAFPSADATNEFQRLAPPIMQWVNSHADPKIYGSIAVDTNRSELKWNGLPLCAPILRASTQYVSGGFGLTVPREPRLPNELHAHILQETNLVFFDWEFAAETLPQWRYLDDISRMAFDAAHASRLRNNPVSTDWLLTNVTNLSHSVTEVRQMNPKQLVLTRRSTLGLNAVELNILINWLATSEFPGGMSSLWRTNPASFRPVRLTNSPPVNAPSSR